MNKKDPFKSYYDFWLDVKEEALESKDFAFYKIFLEANLKHWTKFYPDCETDEGRKLVESYLKLTSEELKGLNRRLKEQSIPF